MQTSTGANAVTDYERKINLTALRKCDEFVLDIVETSSQVAVYKFDASKKAWEKTEIEGSFFLYRRSSLPKFSVMIMNRLNRENLNVHIGKEMEFKVQKPFLLYKDPSTGIQGIWFNNTEKCEKIGDMIGKLYTSGKVPEKDVREERGQTTMSNVEVEKRDNVDENNILSIFAQAQRKYDENKDQTTRNGAPIPTPTRTSATEKSILSGKTRSKSLSIQQAPPLPLPNERGSIPSTAVEHEDRQIHETLDDDPCIIKSSPLRPSSSSLSKSLPNSSKKIQRQLFTQELPSPYAKQATNEKIPFPAVPAPQTTPISKAIVIKPALSSQRSGSDITLAASLMSPLAFKPTKALSHNQPEQPPPPPVLTKEQLQDTLMNLLQKDSEFLEKIHSAYLKNASR